MRYLLSLIFCVNLYSIDYVSLVESNNRRIYVGDSILIYGEFLSYFCDDNFDEKQKDQSYCYLVVKIIEGNYPSLRLKFNIGHVITFETYTAGDYVQYNCFYRGALYNFEDCY